MQVILLEDIKGVGKKGQLINASDGHARNYLLPRKLAVEATKGNLNELEARKKSEANKAQNALNTAQKLAKEIAEKSVKIAVKTGENGKLFGSVTNKEIAAALAEQAGLTIDKKKIAIPEPFKTTGEKTVDIKLHPKVTAQLTVTITTL